MRTLVSTVIVALFIGGYSIGAGAQATVRNDGNKLLKDCQGYMQLVEDGSYPSSAVFGQGYCLGLVFGVMNTTRTMCVPGGVVSGIQAVQVVLRYLNDNAGALGERDTQLVNRALSEAYPCT